jgi:ABC-2 type transport system permease protein
MLTAIGAVIGRDLLRFVRQRGRLVASLTRPLIWLFIIGTAYEHVIHTHIGAMTYRRFMLPGILAMVILFSAFISALITVHDREFGPLRMLLIAPLRRWLAVIAKIMSSGLIGLVQAVLLLPLIWILGLEPPADAVLATVGALALASLTISSLGLLLASRLRSIENFAVVFNSILFPAFFLSGALYRSSSLPSILQPLVSANPVTYAVDLIRHGLYAATSTTRGQFDFSTTTDALVLVAITLVSAWLAIGSFGQEERMDRVLLLGAPGVARRAPLRLSVLRAARRMRTEKG